MRSCGVCLVLEQIGLDGDNVSDGSSARNSNGSCNENAHGVDTRVVRRKKQIQWLMYDASIVSGQIT